MSADDPLQGISTVNLELRIEQLAAEIEPKHPELSRSFGVNIETWRQLTDAVGELLRRHRNTRRDTPDTQEQTPRHH